MEKDINDKLDLIAASMRVTGHVSLEDAIALESMIPDVDWRNINPQAALESINLFKIGSVIGIISAIIGAIIGYFLSSKNGTSTTNYVPGAVIKESETSKEKLDDKIAEVATAIANKEIVLSANLVSEARKLLQFTDLDSDKKDKVLSSSATIIDFFLNTNCFMGSVTQHLFKKVSYDLLVDRSYATRQSDILELFSGLHAQCPHRLAHAEVYCTYVRNVLDSLRGININQASLQEPRYTGDVQYAASFLKLRGGEMSDDDIVSRMGDELEVLFKKVPIPTSQVIDFEEFRNRFSDSMCEAYIHAKNYKKDFAKDKAPMQALRAMEAEVRKFTDGNVQDKQQMHLLLVNIMEQLNVLLHLTKIADEFVKHCDEYLTQVKLVGETYDKAIVFVDRLNIIYAKQKD